MLQDSLPHLWGASMKFLFTPEYILNLVDFLRKNNVKTILDCACRTGYPSIELARAGFSVVSTDGHKDMLSYFQQNTRKENIAIKNYLLDWGHLHELNETFDAVICIGNWLIYADSWGGAIDWRAIDILKNIEDNIKFCLKQMYDRLNKGGLLYIDITSQEEFKRGDYIEETHSDTTVDNKLIKIVWKITHDWKNRIRTVHSERTEDDRMFEFNYYSYILNQNDLVNILRSVGFNRVEKITMAGANNYDTFVCYK